MSLNTFQWYLMWPKNHDVTYTTNNGYKVLVIYQWKNATFIWQ
jgi:hypothetical protein